IVRENRSVVVRYIAHENVADAGLRKPTERSGDIRVIDIAGYDRSACGGTHVRITGEIGPILITGIERAKKQIRVQFICGDRVLQYARRANSTLNRSAKRFQPPLSRRHGLFGRSGTNIRKPANVSKNWNRSYWITKQRGFPSLTGLRRPPSKAVALRN